MDEMNVTVGELREPEHLNLDQRNETTYDLYLKYLIQGLGQPVYVIEKFLEGESRGFYFSKKIEDGCSERITDEQMNELCEEIMSKYLAVKSKKTTVINRINKSNVIPFPIRSN